MKKLLSGCIAVLLMSCIFVSSVLAATPAFSRKQSANALNGLVKVTVEYTVADPGTGLQFAGINSVKATEKLLALANGYTFSLRSYSETRLSKTRFRVNITGTIIVSGYVETTSFYVDFDI